MSAPATAPAVHRPLSLAEWAMLLCVAGFWGGSYFFTGIAIKELPVFSIVMARYAVSAPILLTLIWWLGQRFPWDGAVIRAGLFLAVFNQLVPFSLISWGQSHIPSAVASILNAAGPIVTLVLAHFLTHDEKMTTRRFAGIVIGFAGMAIMIGASALQAMNVDIAAQCVCVLATVSYGYANIVARRFTRSGVRPTELVAAQAVIAGILLLPVLLIVDRPWTLPVPSAGTWAALLGLGLLSSTLGHLIFFKLLTTAGSTNISLVSYFMPVSAILLGVAFLGEHLETRHVLGIATIVFGLAIMDGRLMSLMRRLLRRPA
ncbi:MAG: DMT family transporter [Beijerinckiaceae bacterium]